MIEPADDSLAGIDLERYAEVDRLMEEYRLLQQRGEAPAPQDFAARHPELADLLLPALGAIGALQRGERGSPGTGGGRLAVGAQVGRFTVVGELGHGGMGTVYEASEEGLERTVALKVLDAAMAGEAFRARFVREARAAAKLEHPAIVPVYGTGTEGTLLWYAMRRIEGAALDELLTGLSGDAGPELQAEAEEWLLKAAGETGVDASGSAMSGAAAAGTDAQVAVARLGQRLASALAYAHAEGVLHRDVKPGNVLLDGAGQPHLTDFGLCKLEGEASITEATDVIGTLRYMPPEALQHEADERGDVYGLGLVLYELLTRTPAFERKDRARTILDIERVDPPAIRKIDPTVPQDLERIVMKSIAKLPEERYAGAGTMAADLGAFLAGKPIQARPLGPGYVLRLLVRRHRAAVTVAGVAALLMVVATVLYVVSLLQLVDDVEEARGVAETRAATATLRFAQRQLEDGDLGGTRSLLEGIAQGQRGWVWKHLRDRAAPQARSLQLAINDPIDVVAFPDGTAFAWGREVLHVFDPRTLRRLAERSSIVRGGQGVTGEMFAGAAPTGNGREVLALKTSRFRGAGSHGLVRWSGARFTDTELLFELPARPRQLRVNQAAGRAVFLCEGRLHLVELAAPGLQRTLPVPADLRVNTLELLDGGDVVLGSRSGELVRLDVETGAFERLGRHDRGVTSLLCEGDRLVASADAGGDVVFQPTGFAPRNRCRVGDSVDFLSRAAGGALLAGVRGGRLATIDEASRVVRELRSCFTVSCAGAFVAPDEDGAPIDFIVSEKGEIQRLAPDPSPGALAAASAGAQPRRASVAPRGDRLGFLSLDGFLHLVGEDVQRFAAETRQADVAFHQTRPLVAAGGLVVDVERGEEVLRWWPESGECHDACWVGDELAMFVWWYPEGLAHETRQLDLWVWDASRPERAPEKRAKLRDLYSWNLRPRCFPLPERNEVLLADANGTLQRFRVADGGPVWASDVEIGRTPCLALDRARDEILITGDEPGVRTLDLETGALVERERGEFGALVQRGKRINAMDISDTLGLLATADGSGQVRVWSHPGGEGVMRLDFAREQVFDLRFVPGEGLLVNCGVGVLRWLGHGEVPAFVRAPGRFASTDALVAAALAPFEGEPTLADRVTATVVAAQLGLGDPDQAVPAGSPLARLREIALDELGPDELMSFNPLHVDRRTDGFGRFGFTHFSFY